MFVILINHKPNIVRMTRGHKQRERERKRKNQKSQKALEKAKLEATYAFIMSSHQCYWIRAQPSSTLASSLYLTQPWAFSAPPYTDSSSLCSIAEVRSDWTTAEVPPWLWHAPLLFRQASRGDVEKLWSEITVSLFFPISIHLILF